MIFGKTLIRPRQIDVTEIEQASTGAIYFGTSRLASSLPQRHWPHRLRRILAGAVCTLLVVAIGWNLWLRYEVHSFYQVMRAHGIPTNPRELDRYYAVPAGSVDNSNAWNPAIAAISPTVRRVISPELLPYLEGPHTIPLPGTPWNLSTEATQCLDALAPQLKSIRSAASLGGRTRLPLDYSVGYFKFKNDSRQVRDAVVLLCFDAAVAARTGDQQRCRDSQKAAWALCEAIQGQPDIIGMLCWASVLAINGGQLERLMPVSGWTDEELAQLQRQICQFDCRKQLEVALSGECVDHVNFMEQSPFPFHSPGNELDLITLYSTAKQELKQPWPLVLSKYGEIDAAVDATKYSRIERYTRAGFRLTAPRLKGYGKSAARTAARQACLNAGLATQRFRLRRGRWPTSLSEIDADLFGRQPDGNLLLDDPFDGKALRFQSDAKRCLIYSVGDNQVDDGGDVSWPEDSHRAPRDLGFSLSP